MPPSREDAVDGRNHRVKVGDSSTVDDGQWEDFTCQGSWEDFIRALEGVLRDWKYCNTGGWIRHRARAQTATCMPFIRVDKQGLWC